MKTKDEALRMALEALEAEHSAIYGTSQTARAIAAIREVLAQPERPAVQGEPVAWDNCRNEYQCRFWCGNSSCASHFEDTTPQPVPERKPLVGLTDAEREKLRWQALEADAGYTQLIKATEAKLREKNAVPERKPLTDEEIDSLALDGDGLPNSHLEFARAIERAHGIGEKPDAA